MCGGVFCYGEEKETVSKPREDLTGRVSGKLTVVRITDIRAGKDIKWECICECGNTTYVAGSDLRGNKTKSCGCSRIEKAASLVGMRYGMLTVTAITKNQNNHTRLVCLCDCGNTKLLTYISLVHHEHKSCGCKIVKGANHWLSKGEMGTAFTSVYHNYKTKAKSRDYVFDLTQDEFKRICIMNCVYCNRVPSNRNKSINKAIVFVYNGIDRVDNTKGYTVDNCVPCCKICNRAKADMSHHEFIEFISTVYHNYVEPKEGNYAQA